MENIKNVTLCARQYNESEPSRLLNAPCFIPNLLAGPYWVLAAGPVSNNYSWAWTCVRTLSFKYRNHR